MRSKRFSAVIAAVAVAGSLGVAGTVSALGNGVDISSGGSNARLSCPGGMVRLSQVLDEDAVIFEGDPVPTIEPFATIDPDFFLAEKVSIGTHTGTHLSAPGHFIEGAPTIDDLAGSEFAWPAYVIDVQDRVAQDPDFQLSAQEIRTYERQVGKIPKGALGDPQHRLW